MILNLICKYKKCRLKLFQTALLLITLYNLLLISFTAFTKASESEGSKEERSAWTISEHTAPLPYSDMRYGGRVSTHSYPKTAGHLTCFLSEWKYMFQHTAARRRLDDNVFPEYHQRRVSTHSRREGGWHKLLAVLSMQMGFNTQPPEGGWVRPTQFAGTAYLFQHTAA